MSICIPAFNQRSLFQRAIESALAQDYPQFEILVLDDSDEQSVEAVALAPGDHRVRYYKNECTLGPARNWNRGMALSQGEYIKFLHHDDWFDSPRSLAILVDRLLDANADFVFSASSATRADGTLKNVNRVSSSDLSALAHDPAWLLRRGNVIGAPSATLFRRDLAVRFDPRLKWLIDMDFYISYLRRNPRTSYVDQALIHTTTESDHQVTFTSERNPEVEIPEWDMVLRKQYGSSHMGRLIKLVALSQTYDNLGRPDWLKGLPLSTQMPISAGQLLRLMRNRRLSRRNRMSAT